MRERNVLSHDETVMGTVVSFTTYFEDPNTNSDSDPGGAGDCGGDSFNSGNSGDEPMGAGDIETGDIETGDIETGDIETGPIRTGTLEAISQACGILHEADSVFSLWNPNSQMSRMRTAQREPGKAFLVDPSIKAQIDEVLELCQYAKELSRGWFDPWAMPLGVDPTGLVKGWAVEKAVRHLEQAGLSAAIANGGGDIATFGKPNESDIWQIGIRHPWRADSLACILQIDQAVATSGTYERGSHLVDPHTHKPTCRVASATVTGPNLAIADALATGLAVAGPSGIEWINPIQNYEAYVIALDGSEHSTAGIVFADSDAPKRPGG